MLYVVGIGEEVVFVAGEVFFQCAEDVAHDAFAAGIRGANGSFGKVGFEALIVDVDVFQCVPELRQLADAVIVNFFGSFVVGALLFVRAVSADGVVAEGDDGNGVQQGGEVGGAEFAGSSKQQRVRLADAEHFQEARAAMPRFPAR